LETIGYFDKFLPPRVRLIVKGLRKSLRIDPVVDTGFDGDLCLPIKMAIQLGLELSGRSLVELADGSKRHELSFFGFVIWQEKERLVEIFLTDSKDVLVGSGLLQGQKLIIGYANHSVTIEPDIIPDSGKRKKRKSKK
jgi:clan AA aspartic protease